MPPTLTLHAVPPSHPCMTVAAALELKGLEYERVDFPHSERLERMEEIYGEGNSTVPGLLIDEQPVHGSRAILARLEAIEPTPTLYPSEQVREAERWGDEELQDLGRRLPWGALHFRPEAMGTFAGGEPLDPAGTDFAIKFVRATWRYHGITAARLHDDLAGLPAKIAHIEQLAEDDLAVGQGHRVGGIVRGRRQAREFGDVALPNGYDRPDKRGERGRRTWHVRLPGRDHPDPGV